MKEKKNVKTARKPEPKFWQSVLVLLITVALIAVALLVEKVDNVHAALFLAAVVAVVAAMLIGFKWSALEKMMINGISRSLQSILILLVIGMMIGVWMYSGVVPAMIYLAAVMVICSISSIATGSSWGTAASMGIAFLGISHGLGINPAITAGAVISGAYFGDKMSPLSDTTNLAPAMAGTDVMTHVKFMLIPTGITYIVTLAIFALMPVAANINLFGFHRLFYTGVSAGNMDVANALGDAIKQAFPNINPLLMLPPVVVIVAIALKVPAIPGLTLGLFSGALLGVIFKDGTSFKVLIDTCYGGFGLEKEFVFSGAYNDEVLKTVNAAIKELLGNLDPEAYDTTGGISNMGGTIALIMIAMMYGGVMEGTGAASWKAPACSASSSRRSRRSSRPPPVWFPLPRAPASSPTWPCPTSTFPSSSAAVCTPRTSTRWTSIPRRCPTRWRAPPLSPPLWCPGTPAVPIWKKPWVSRFGELVASAPGRSSTG